MLTIWFIWGKCVVLYKRFFNALINWSKMKVGEIFVFIKTLLDSKTNFLFLKGGGILEIINGINW